MATVQQYIQPIAQNNTPFLANNGNPGTVYNMPNTGSYKPPMASAQNQWALNPNASAYANNQFWLNNVADTPAGGGGGSPFFTVPPITVIPGSVIPPPVTPPTTVTPPNGGGGGATGGGTVDPSVYNPSNPAGVFGGPAGSMTGPQLPGTSFNNYTQTAGGGGGAINWSGGVQGILGSAWQALGGKPGGGMDWQQALDLVLPGDLYNSETGRWNAGNSIIAAANAINPAIGALVQLAIDKGWAPAVLRQRIIDDGLAQANADLKGTVSDLTSQTRAILENRTNQTLAGRDAMLGNMFMPGGQGWTGLGSGASGVLGSSPFDNAYSGDILDRMDGWTGTPTRDGRSGTSTGSGVVWNSDGSAGGSFLNGLPSYTSALNDMLNNSASGFVRDARLEK